VAVSITVPRLGWSMEEGTLLEWLKQDGDVVRPGDALYVLEGEKAAEEIEALDAGILRLPPDGPRPGDRVKVGQVLAYLLAEGEGLPVVSQAQPAVAIRTAATAAGPAARQLARSLGVDIGSVSGSGPGGRVTEADVRQRKRPVPEAQRKIAISPRARRVARDLGIDWQGLSGSGRNGRIRERDVRAATQQTGGRLIAHTTTRRTIAARMVAGVTLAAPVTLTTKADATNLVNLRDQFKTATPDFVPSYSDLLLKLNAASLRRHPLLQAQWRDDGLFVPDRIDIAFAVETEAGLLVPVVRGVDRLAVKDISNQTKGLIAQARAGQLSAEQMRDATFTVSNLGAHGVDAFTPIIHLPQCAVLGVGRIVREPAVFQDAVVPRDMLTLSLTFDHRVVDGAPAARFLDTLRQSVEQPAPWLLT
jgi:pyruvate dehydrogenase E2 component (dihydrolipoamide acetyltransferase)